jgi:cellulose biosynthesis protein BcsQ
VALYSIKEGVGKTSSAVNLAFISACKGYRTLVWDLDPQGASSYYFRIKPKVKGGFIHKSPSRNTFNALWQEMIMRIDA